MKLEITRKDWNAIYALIDTLHDWSDNLNGDYKKDYVHFHKNTTKRIYKQIREKRDQRTPPVSSRTRQVPPS